MWRIIFFHIGGCVNFQMSYPDRFRARHFSTLSTIYSPLSLGRRTAGIEFN